MKNFFFLFVFRSHFPRCVDAKFENCIPFVPRTVTYYRVHIFNWRQCLWMAIVWCKSCTYFWAWSQESSVGAASHGIGGHIWRRLDTKHFKFSVQCQFKYTSIYKSTCFGHHYGLIPNKSAQNFAARRTVLATSNFGKIYFPHIRFNSVACKHELFVIARWNQFKLFSFNSKGPNDSSTIFSRWIRWFLAGRSIEFISHRFAGFPIFDMLLLCERGLA